ncbi:DNA-directed RNA polymerase, alpha subunit, putative [Plasmodium vivax]|uniref:DNA-directed RNA polymerase, alpha subunit, putative n=1 Tax=Plasmodium vivax (strain Salvador I) TaxID=126793 RepID=A5K332_PLAVS|nr:DNA-directed RNA polymerase, alpha subunit, putative [Plasmodium vivax]EDL45936.1 DNA-directed RNA polymerase, alpha subunit, putative [Plasmodium vivax]|eukprot:XP_001615663.1 DNA-directed RNA polymerase, alpha subunit [Plasmodium vivax Sal-1]
MMRLLGLPAWASLLITACSALHIRNGCFIRSYQHARPIGGSGEEQLYARSCSGSHHRRGKAAEQNKWTLFGKDGEIKETGRSEPSDDYKLMRRKNFIKKYQVKREEVEAYIEQMKRHSSSGYEPQFPKDAFRTPDGLTNVILDYKYKNDNLKIHNYYSFFVCFLRKLAEQAEKKKKSEPSGANGPSGPYEPRDSHDPRDPREPRGEREGEPLISVQDLLFLKKKGFFEGDLYTWKNWVILNRGEWEDCIGYGEADKEKEYQIETLRKMVEPKMKRMPIEYWGSFRAIDFNVNHYPIYKRLFDFFDKVTVSGNEPNEKFYPFLFYPRFGVRRDRSGLGYGDAQFFGNYGDIYKKREQRQRRGEGSGESGDGGVSGESDERGVDGSSVEGSLDGRVDERVVHSSLHRESFIDKYDFGPNDIKVEEATDIIKYPQNGRLYQKFYIGPLNITDGHTFGTLLKYVCQTQLYGYAIVAIKIHNMNEDTRIDNVQEDLLEIALNLSDVCIYSKEVNIETNIRLIFKGPLMLVAGMIPLPSHLQVVNKEQYICTLKEDGHLDISIKIEYGKGHWLTYEKGLYKRELGSDNECMKKRQVKEVVEKNYMPISASFGTCRMVRMAVHKIATKYWCEDRCEFTDPKQMLVMEIWTDCRMLPKNVLLYGIKNIKKILRKFREMIISDSDFPSDAEDEEMKKLWPAIDRYKFLQTKQKMEGGPPIHDVDAQGGSDVSGDGGVSGGSAGCGGSADSGGSDGNGERHSQMVGQNLLDSFSQKLVDPDNFPKHSNIILPLEDTPPPYLDTLEWLKMEVKKDRIRKKRKGSEKKTSKAANRRTFDYDDYLDDRLGDILDEG